MSTELLALTAALVVAAPTDTHEIDALVREDLALVLFSPTPELHTTSFTEIYRIASNILHAHTSLDLETFDGVSSIDDCHGALGCIALAIAAADPKRATSLRWLAVFSIKGNVDGTDHLSAVLVDVPEAMRARELGDDFEDAVFAHAVRASPPPSTLAHSTDVERTLAHLFLEDFKDAFTASKSWIKTGALEIASDVPGAEIRIDDRLVGVTFEGATRIAGLALGKRRIALRRGEVEVLREVEIASDHEARIEAVLSPAAVDMDHGTARSALLWAGIGTASAGTAIVLAALLDSKLTHHDELCLDPAASSCGASGFVKLDGVMLAPLGWSLALTGAIFSGGALLGSDDRFPWIELILGLTGGAASYLASARLSR